MHEMSLAEGIRGIVESAASGGAFSRVRRVVLEIGVLSVVEKDALRFCFEAVMRGTVAEGATLEMIDLPGAGRCLQCGHGVAIAARFDPCPLCGSYRVEPTAGMEMRVRELEVD
ncbi:MAG: hydrogenase maturation nickel metallochaperone HypA [Rhodocyclaceae bacterium]|nr:hydrogenase maturation nickel metallochaperone HypA [Rhodocyclaceae bacterium]